MDAGLEVVDIKQFCMGHWHCTVRSIPLEYTEYRNVVSRQAGIYRIQALPPGCAETKPLLRSTVELSLSAVKLH